MFSESAQTGRVYAPRRHASRGTRIGGRGPVHGHRARARRRLRSAANLRTPLGPVARKAVRSRGGIAVSRRARLGRLAGDVARFVSDQHLRRRSGDPRKEPRRPRRRDVPGRGAGARLRGPAPRRAPRGRAPRRDRRRRGLAVGPSRPDARRAGQLLLEITAGQGSCLGCDFEEVATILDRARRRRRPRRLLRHLPRPRLRPRPQHRGGIRSGVRALRPHHRPRSAARVSPQRLEDADGSRVDRHAEIGEGYLGLLPFWRLVNDPRFATTPAVLETPSGPDGKSSFARNLSRLRGLIGAPRPAGPPKSQALPDKKDPRQGRLFA